MKDERGEIATLLTIGTLVVIGVTAVVSSLFINQNKTTNSKAAEPVNNCIYSMQNLCLGECGTNIGCSKCKNGKYRCSNETDDSASSAPSSAGYPDPNCGSYTMRQGAGDCYTICQSHNESYVGPSTTDGTTGHKCCCKPVTGPAATCNSTKTYCKNECTGGTTDTSKGYYQGKGEKANKNYESSDCSGTALELSKFCCKGAALCEGASEANMCPDGNNVRNKCIGSTSGQYKCCGPHDNKEYPTANYATWNSTGTCGGATGLENLPAGCCFTDTDCNKYGSGQVCNIPNGSCGGAGGKSCNSNKKGKYQQQCVNQQCVNQPCDGPDDECVQSKYCANSTACQQQYGSFTCPEKDTGNNGQAVYSWADGNGTKCVCMNCKVYGNAPNYTCGSDTQNNYDGSLCCQKEPAKSGAACSAYNQNTCGIKDKPCCTGAGINPCKTDDLTCDASKTCKPKISATTCTTSKGGTIPRDGKTHCIPAIDSRTFGLCYDGVAAATEVQCGVNDGTCAAGYGANGGDGCSKGAYATCNTSVAGKTIANDGKFHCVDKDTFGVCPKVGNVAGNAIETDCGKNPDYPVCSETGFPGGEQAGCVKADTNGNQAPAANCNSAGTPCSTFCANRADGKIYVEVPNDYWYINPKYYTKKSGVCTEDTIDNICKCTATPPTGNTVYSYNIVLTVDGTAKGAIKNYTLKTAGGISQAQGALSTNPLTFGGKFGPDVNSTTKCVIEVSGDSISQTSDSFLCSSNASTSVKVTVNGTGDAGDNVTCYSKTCGSICQDFYGMSSKAATTDKWFKPGDDVYFYGNGRCDGIDRNNIERNLKSSCQCEAPTFFTIVNNCDKAVTVQKISFKRGVGIDWYILPFDTPVSSGKSVSKGAFGVCQAAAYLEYKTESDTQHDVVFNITNCNGVNQWEISGAVNCN